MRAFAASAINAFVLTAMLLIMTTSKVLSQNALDEWVGIWEGTNTTDFINAIPETVEVTLVISKTDNYTWAWDFFYHENIALGYPKFTLRYSLQFEDSSATPYAMKKENGFVSYFRLFDHHLFSSYLIDGEEGTWTRNTNFQLSNGNQLEMMVTQYPLPQEKHVFGKMEPTLMQKAILHRKK